MWQSQDIYRKEQVLASSHPHATALQLVAIGLQQEIDTPLDRSGSTVFNAMCSVLSVDTLLYIVNPSLPTRTDLQSRSKNSKEPYEISPPIFEASRNVKCRDSAGEAKRFVRRVKAPPSPHSPDRSPHHSPDLKRFLDRLPVPPVLQPRPGQVLNVGMRQFRQKLHAQMPPTLLWGYDGIYPGPTIEAPRRASAGKLAKLSAD
jgi:hypothetical protein